VLTINDLKDPTAPPPHHVATLLWEKVMSENHCARYFVINELARKLTYGCQQRDRRNVAILYS